MRYEEDTSIKVQRHSAPGYIYFLVDGEEVVYVGQTTQGIARPLSHNGKEFDSFYMIPCQRCELDTLEDFYIKKYMPKYNKKPNDNVNFSLQRAKKMIQEEISPTIGLRKIKKAIAELGINYFSMNGISYIEKEDFDKLFRHLISAYVCDIVGRGKKRRWE